MKMKINLLAILALSVLVYSCSSSDNDEKKEPATIQVALIDAPGDYESVMIDIQDIQVNVSADDSDENGWQSLEGGQPGIYDLLLLTNGQEAFLGTIELPEGQLGQVRLILGESNEVTVDGTTHALTIPSGSQSGLKLNVQQSILAGITYKLLLDFDAAKSIVSAGNSGKYNLKPVIRASFEAQTGAISGVIDPAEVASVAYALIGSDSVSTYPDETGEFLIRALDPGIYDVVAIPAVDSIGSVTVTGLEVVAGLVTSADTLRFE